MARVMIRLENEERDALLILARREKRDARAQAALLICAELERLGLLAREPMTANGAPSADAGREEMTQHAKAT